MSESEMHHPNQLTDGAATEPTLVSREAIPLAYPPRTTPRSRLRGRHTPSFILGHSR